MRKIISVMHLSPDGFVAGPNGEMDRIKVDEEIFVQLLMIEDPNRTHGFMCAK